MQHIFPSLEYYHHFIQQTTYLFLKGSHYSPHFFIFLYEGFSRFPFKKLLKISIFTHENQDTKTRFTYPFCIKIKKINTTHLTRQSLQEIIIFKKVNMTTFSKYTQTHISIVTLATLMCMQHVFFFLTQLFLL